MPKKIIFVSCTLALLTFAMSRIPAEIHPFIYVGCAVAALSALLCLIKMPLGISDDK